MNERYSYRQKNNQKTYEHVLAVERILGKKLPRGAIVHHVNTDSKDNRTVNLVVCPDQAYHVLIHYRMRALDESGNADNLKCCYCRKWDAAINLTVSSSIYHKNCWANYKREWTALNRDRLNKARREKRAKLFAPAPLKEDDK